MVGAHSIESNHLPHKNDDNNDDNNNSPFISEGIEGCTVLSVLR